MRRLRPGEEQFVRAAREAFGYLIADFGFREEAVNDEHKLEVAFSNGQMRVVVEGRDWGLNTRVAVGSATPQFENFDLEDLITLRLPASWPRAARGSIERGSRQLDQVRFYADVLRRIGDDILRNDNKVFPELQRVIDARAAALRRANEKN